MTAIKAGTYLGIFNMGDGTTAPVYARSFGESAKLYPCPNFKSGFTVRSRNFCLAASGVFTQASGITDADLSALEPSAASDPAGWQSPTGFTDPVGFNKLSDEFGFYYVPKSGDTNGDGVTDINDTPSTVRSANVFTQVWDWAKANPFLAGAIVLGVVVLYNSMTKKGKGRRKKILGLI